jgi:hypothetical protein
MVWKGNRGVSCASAEIEGRAPRLRAPEDSGRYQRLVEVISEQVKRLFLVAGSVRYGVGRGGFSLSMPCIKLSKH